MRTYIAGFPTSSDPEVWERIEAAIEEDRRLAEEATARYWAEFDVRVARRVAAELEQMEVRF